MKTNLFIAGSCKSGTTFLHDFLGAQKGIFSAEPKEPYFFELPEAYRDEKKYREKYFANATGNETYWLDSRHRTMFFHWIPKEIKKFNPNAKFIFILRNPVDRAFSHWWMWYSRGILKKSFHKTIQPEIKKIEEGVFEMNKSPEAYFEQIQNNVYNGRLAYADANTIVETGFYYTQLKRFYDTFEPNQLLILDYEELKQMDSLKKKLSEFLKIEIQNMQVQKVVNQAKKHKKSNSKLAWLLPTSIKRYIKNTFYSKPKIKEKDKKLLMLYYKQENDKLVQELGLNFVIKWSKLDQ